MDQKLSGPVDSTATIIQKRLERTKEIRRVSYLKDHDQQYEDIENEARDEPRNSIRDSLVRLSSYSYPHYRTTSTSNSRRSSTDYAISDLLGVRDHRHSYTQSQHSIASTASSIHTVITALDKVDSNSNSDEASSFPSEAHAKARRPSLLSRLTASRRATFPVTPCRRGDLKIELKDFKLPPPWPETRFVDSIGMVIPGVCDRPQCTARQTHFVSNWRICQPLEYTTGLADHGITYTDYCRLNRALADFLVKLPVEPSARPTGKASRWSRSGGSHEQLNEETSTEACSDIERQANKLNELLEGITNSWRGRGVPVMVCLYSLPLFHPHTFTEALVQILHTPFWHAPETSHPAHPPRTQPTDVTGDAFIHDQQFIIAQTESRRSVSHPSPLSPFLTFQHLAQAPVQDRTKPWPIGPDNIPAQKRYLVDSFPGLYGSDPYFRHCVQENIKGRTKARSYSEYIIEKEGDCLANAHLDYVPVHCNSVAAWDFLISGGKKGRPKAGITNKMNYRHNRILECRKNVELGSRFRIARFAFRCPLWPPHNSEMEELGLSKEMYRKTIMGIEAIRQDFKSHHRPGGPRFCPVAYIRRGLTQDAVCPVAQYLKRVNSEQHRLGASVVWTMEEIPGVYDKRSWGKGSEWEISIWDQRDPLELLKHLEGLGVVQKRLFAEELLGGNNGRYRTL